MHVHTQKSFLIDDNLLVCVADLTVIVIIFWQIEAIDLCNTLSNCKIIKTFFVS